MHRSTIVLPDEGFESDDSEEEFPAEAWYHRANALISGLEFELYRKKRAKVPLPLNEVKAPEQLHDEDEMQCVICLRSDVTKQEKMCVVPCGHAHFCADCLRRAVKYARNCPTCRCSVNGIARLP